MSKKDDELAKAKEAAQSAAPASVGALLEEEKHATREEVDRMTNKATDPNAVNIVASLAEEAKPVKEEKKKPLSEAEYERRTRLDVSDALYINPSLDHKG